MVGIVMQRQVTAGSHRGHCMQSIDAQCDIQVVQFLNLLSMQVLCCLKLLNLLLLGICNCLQRSYSVQEITQLLIDSRHVVLDETIFVAQLK